MHCGISGRARAIFSAVLVGYLLACLQVGWSCAITMPSQKHVVCCDLVIFGHLILCHSCSEAEKKKTWSVYKACIQIWVLFPWQGICLDILFPRCQRKVKGKNKKKRASKQGRERGTPSLNILPGWSVWLVISIFSPSAPSWLYC